MPRPKQRTPELRAHVLNEALQLLKKDGVGAFTARRVAACANTSTPAVYELFGDKQGLVREIFLEGFRRLRACFEAVAQSDDSKADLIALIYAFRAFAIEQPILAEVMFSRPFSDFSPGPADLAAMQSVNIAVVDQIRRCIADGILVGDPIDVAHALMSAAQGLAAAENASRLGSTRKSADRRWALAVDALLRGLASD